LKRTPFKRSAEIIAFSTLKRTGIRARAKSTPAAPNKHRTAPTRAAEHMAWVRTCECHQCGLYGASEAHHCFHHRYGNRKASDWLTIPLCEQCHREGPDAIHRIKRTWMERNGPDYGLVPWYLELSPVDGALTDGLDALAKYVSKAAK